MKMLSRQSRPSPARLSALGYKALRVIDCNDAIKEACRSSSPWRGRGPVTVSDATRLPGCKSFCAALHDKRSSCTVLLIELTDLNLAGASRFQLSSRTVEELIKFLGT